MKRLIALAAAGLLLAGCADDALVSVSLGGSTPGTGWSQWGQDARHQGRADVVGMAPNAILADVLLDPFIEQEIAEVSDEAEGERDLLVHYQAPLIAGDDVYMQTKGGVFTPCNPPGSGEPAPCGVDAWSSEIWREDKWTWNAGKLEHQWSFESDWKPPPNGWVSGGWEPVFHAVLAGDNLLVPAARGAISVVDRHTGEQLALIKPFGQEDPNKQERTFVAGPLAISKTGDAYYHAVRLQIMPPYTGLPGTPTTPWDLDVEDAWLVHIAPGGAVSKASFQDLVTGAPDPKGACPGGFYRSQLPWPPDPDAKPVQVQCGSQRPGLNVAPAIADDGTIYTVSRAHFAGRRSFMVAVNPDLSTKWVESFAGRLHDGCGTDSLPPTGQLGGCNEGAKEGVDPATNAPGSGIVVDSSTASPVVTPDGGVLYGTYTRYNYARGHLFHFGPDGSFRGTYPFGWDITPAIYEHDGTYSILLKENNYGTGSYCNNPDICPPREEGPFFLTQISPDMQIEWRYPLANDKSCKRDQSGEVTCVSDHPNGFEWCINAPAVDKNGTVYGNGEDGVLYAIPQGGDQAATMFLGESIGAAYTPLSIDPKGRVYAQNIGRLFVVGE